MLPSRYANVTAARARFGDRVDRLGAFFWKVDPLADDVVAAIEQSPGLWQLFAEASKRGIAHVPNAPEALKAFFNHVERIPMWVEWDKVDRGGELLTRAGPLGGIVLALKSLVTGYASPGGNKPLVFSGRLKEQAPRRLNETARFIQATITPGATKPQGEAWQITLKVRLMHAHVRRMILKTGRWDSQAWGEPVNQHDMVGTSLLFSTVVLEGLRQLGMRIARRDAENYMHLWRWSSWLMGVDPELLSATEREGTRLGELLALTLGEPDDDSRALTKALLESPMQVATTQNERLNARRLLRFSAGMCRELLGEEMADKLAVPRTSWRFMVPFAKRLVSSVELVRERVPFADVPAVWAGRRYWERVLAVGIAGATSEFALPTSLSRLATRKTAA